MPLFFFSTEATYDADDGLDYPGPAEACRAAEVALLAIAAENPPRPNLIMSTWDANGVLLCQLCLAVTVLEGEHPDLGRASPGPIEEISEQPRSSEDWPGRNHRRTLDAPTQGP